jgi:hypothetical protein
LIGSNQLIGWEYVKASARWENAVFVGGFIGFGTLIFRAYALEKEVEIVAQKTVAEFTKMENKSEAQFAKIEAKNNAQFAKIEATFSELEAKNDAQFAKIEAKNDAQFSELRGDLKLIVGLVSIGRLPEALAEAVVEVLKKNEAVNKPEVHNVPVPVMPNASSKD